MGAKGCSHAAGRTRILIEKTSADQTRCKRSLDDDNTGLGDTFVQPFWLGWSGSSYDLSFGLGLYVPTGEYDADADDNISLGFWTAQVQTAGYYFLDEAQAGALMAAVTYEIHGEKEDTDTTPEPVVQISARNRRRGEARGRMAGL
jgi:hypothetical protein